MKKNSILQVSAPVNFSPKMSIVLCYIECKGKILFLQTHQAKWQGMTWSVPGGKIEPNETAEAAVIREVFEETAIRINPKDLISKGSFFARNSKIDFLVTLFRVCFDEKIPEVILNPAEHIKFVWVTPSEALKLPLMEGADDCLNSIL